MAKIYIHTYHYTRHKTTMTMSTTTKNENVTWGQCEHHKHNHSIIFKWDICYDDYAVAVDGCIFVHRYMMIRTTAIRTEKPQWM